MTPSLSETDRIRAVIAADAHALNNELTITLNALNRAIVWTTEGATPDHIARARSYLIEGRDALERAKTVVRRLTQFSGRSG